MKQLTITVWEQPSLADGGRVIVRNMVRSVNNDKKYPEQYNISVFTRQNRFWKPCLLIVYVYIYIIYMENFRVIRVKIVAPEKSLDVNIFPKNNPDVDFTIYIVSKYLCWYDQLRYPKILCWFRTIGQNQNNCPQNPRCILSLAPFSPSLPSLQYLVLSLCVLCPIPHYVSPGMIPHKKCMIFNYDYHCLIDKCLRMHLLFHLYLQYDICHEQA
jgi:hypothetical protein